MRVPSAGIRTISLDSWPEYAALAAFVIPAGPNVKVTLQEVTSQVLEFLLCATTICAAINAVANTSN